MKKCWSKDPALRPYYDKIIKALNGEEQLLMNDTHKTRDGVDTEHEYQNFVPLADNGKKRILGDKNR